MFVWLALLASICKAPSWATLFLLIYLFFED